MSVWWRSTSDVQLCPQTFTACLDLALDIPRAAKPSSLGLPRVHPNTGGSGNVTRTSSNPVHFITANGVEVKKKSNCFPARLVASQGLGERLQGKVGWQDKILVPVQDSPRAVPPPRLPP